MPGCYGRVLNSREWSSVAYMYTHKICVAQFSFSFGFHKIGICLGKQEQSIQEERRPDTGCTGRLGRETGRARRKHKPTRRAFKASHLALKAHFNVYNEEHSSFLDG